MPSVLVLGVSADGEVSMAFASNFLKFQSDLQRAPDVKASFDVVRTLNDALLRFHEGKEYDYLVAVDVNHGIDNRFLVEFDASKDFVVGIYPERSIDWERVEKHITESHEDAHLVGMRYNVDPASATVTKRHLVVSKAGLNVLKISRRVIDTLVERSRPSDCIHVPGEVDGVYHSTADARVCAAWGKPIYATMDTTSASQLTVVYGPGCIAWRSVLR